MSDEQLPQLRPRDEEEHEGAALDEGRHREHQARGRPAVGERPRDAAGDEAGRARTAAGSGPRPRSTCRTRAALGLGRLGEDRDRGEQQVVGQPDQQRRDVRGRRRPGRGPAAGRPAATTTATPRPARPAGPRPRRPPRPTAAGDVQPQTSASPRREQQPGQPGAQQDGADARRAAGPGHPGTAAAPPPPRGAPAKLMAAPVQKAACTPPISAISPAVGIARTRPRPRR